MTTRAALSSKESSPIVPFISTYAFDGVGLMLFAKNMNLFVRIGKKLYLCRRKE